MDLKSLYKSEAHERIRAEHIKLIKKRKYGSKDSGIDPTLSHLKVADGPSMISAKARYFDNNEDALR